MSTNEVLNKSESESELKRSLKPRHMGMIALGGTIGTGLFFASGNAISSSGPGGAIASFGIMGIVVYFLMTSLGEMATKLPITGSFETYASRFVDPALGFALGWNYWFNWAITVAAELVAAGLIIKFWFPTTRTTIWSVCFLVILLLLNILSAKTFGESEFWFASIKICAIVIFLVIGVLMIFGIMGGKSPGLQNWVLNDGHGHRGPFVGGMSAIMIGFFAAGFSFAGTEVIGLAAGEAENPEKEVPKAINTVFWRILIFYIGAITVIGFLIPFTDPNLLKVGAENIAFSPFTIIFQRSGIAIAASLMNAVILTSVLSCGNSGIYAGSRMLYAMAKEGKAPAFLGKVNKRGVPLNAVYLTTFVASSAFFSTLIGDGKIYMILYNASGLTTFFAWLGIAVCHYRFRKAYIAQGRKLEDLKYKALWFPLGPILAMILCTAVIFGANIWVFQAATFSWFDFITNYALIPIFVLLFYAYKMKYNTKIVPLKECNFEIAEHKKDE